MKLRYFFSLILFAMFAFFPKNSYSEEKIIKMNYYENFAPLSFGSNQYVRGILIDISNLILGKMMGYKVINNGYPWERAQFIVKNNQADGHITVQTKVREEYLLFQTESIYTGSISIFYSSKNPRIQEIEALNSKEDLKKFILGDYIGNGWGKTTFPESEGFKLKKDANVELTLKKIRDGETDIFSAPDILTIKHIINKNHLTGIKVKSVTFLGSNVGWQFCIRKAYPNAENIIKEFDINFLKLKNSGEIDKIFKKYL